jgi:hypothetical protein
MTSGWDSVGVSITPLAIEHQRPRRTWLERGRLPHQLRMAEYCAGHRPIIATHLCLHAMTARDARCHHRRASVAAWSVEAAATSQGRGVRLRCNSVGRRRAHSAPPSGASLHEHDQAAGVVEVDREPRGFARDVRQFEPQDVGLRVVLPQRRCSNRPRNRNAVHPLGPCLFAVGTSLGNRCGEEVEAPRIPCSVSMPRSPDPQCDTARPAYLGCTSRLRSLVNAAGVRLQAALLERIAEALGARLGWPGRCPHPATGPEGGPRLESPCTSSCCISPLTTWVTQARYSNAA